MYRKLKIFLSSTYLDLKYERRFVINLVRRLGHEIVCMEEDCPPGVDWNQWSMNQSRQCDYIICLAGGRAGSASWLPFVDKLRVSISTLEEKQSRGHRLGYLYLVLERPLVGYQVLLNGPDEEAEFDTLLAKPAYSSADHFGKSLHDAVMKTHDIESIWELESCIEANLEVSYWSLLTHDIRSVWRSLADNTTAAWLKASSDEFVHTSSSRLFLFTRIRKFFYLWSIFIAATLGFIGAWSGLVAGLSGLFAAGAMLGITVVLIEVTFALIAPSFFWVGEKSIVVRGLFQLRAQRFSHQELVAIDVYCPKLLMFLPGYHRIAFYTLRFATACTYQVPLVYFEPRLTSAASLKNGDLDRF